MSSNKVPNAVLLSSLQLVVSVHPYEKNCISYKFDRCKCVSQSSSTASNATVCKHSTSLL